VGGIEAVTLSDEEARRRGTQKTVLERRAPPTFDVLVEIQTRDRFTVHLDIMGSVDSLLRGFPIPPEVRTRDESGNIQIEKVASTPKPAFNESQKADAKPLRRSRMADPAAEMPSAPLRAEAPNQNGLMRTVRVYPYGVARNRLMQAAKRLGVPVVVVRDAGEADALVTLRSYYRDRQQTVMDAENRGLPIYVLRANTVNQIEQFLGDMYNLSPELPANRGELENVREQTEQAIAAVLNGERWVDLPPGPSLVRRLQHDMARNAELVSHSYGKEPKRHVRIFRE
jgi:hypothetical protein